MPRLKTNDVARQLNDCFSDRGHCRRLARAGTAAARSASGADLSLPETGPSWQIQPMRDFRKDRFCQTASALVYQAYEGDLCRWHFDRHT